ncbi:phage virion morphogenesis protein [Salmonella enterica subsp. enterica serovar Telelkebir]|uniref:phage virion morphogenesis protein n=3 Tax=Salmonella enterica TaxID=28901 RepID=UPI0012797D10|nr:phage virion morphogenesis protein [Salmonella enterica]EBS6032720.1 phage virion morphogenesis protein [Salmonella enterica subsp. enterica serovar Telelkebir]ECQ1196481.1 phage virion morphogenesis protein [Salmonella enterica subsp. enterica serovar Give]EDE9765548.1 phage virion morphogenesis protein [Salmonella enterica subsp. enterica serovar Bahati]HCC1155872.1 phage virion morphogenesis protein [Salmonella enterica subsp. enterica serovar Choleraesuis]EAS8904692.1 phage virion morph
MSELTALQERLAGLIASLSPAARRQMAADIAKKLRASQQQRIRRQQAPDGTPYAARKRQPVRSKKGRIRREMFARLRTNRFMKAKGSDSAAVVEFTGRVQRMARVHQYGLKDRPNRHSRDVQYAARPLLGFTRDDEQMIENVIVSFLNR